MTFELLPSAAKHNTLLPDLRVDRAFTSALRINRSTMSAFPAFAATIRAVQPLSFRASTAAPRARASVTAARSLPSAADGSEGCLREMFTGACESSFGISQKPGTYSPE